MCPGLCCISTELCDAQLIDPLLLPWGSSSPLGHRQGYFFISPPMLPTVPFIPEVILDSNLWMFDFFFLV